MGDLISGDSNNNNNNFQLFMATKYNSDDRIRVGVNGEAVQLKSDRKYGSNEGSEMDNCNTDSGAARYLGSVCFRSKDKRGRLDGELHENSGGDRDDSSVEVEEGDIEEEEKEEVVKGAAVEGDSNSNSVVSQNSRTESSQDYELESDSPGVTERQRNCQLENRHWQTDIRQKDEIGK